MTKSLKGRNDPKPTGRREDGPIFSPVNVKQVKSYSDLVPLGDEFHRRFDEMIDQTIYIVNIEPLKSDTYGEGYRVHFKDMPNERDTYNAACFGTYVVPQLAKLYDVTHNGDKLLPNTCVRTVIRKAGNSYRFE